MKPHRRKPVGPIGGEALIEVIGSIYEAALDVAQWPAAMGRIARAVDGHRALLFVPEMKSGGEFWAAHDVDPGMMAGYAEYYRHKDLWMLRSYDLALSPGSTLLDETTVSESEYEKSEFWNDFARPIDIFRAACAIIESGQSPATRTYLTVFRPRRSERFDKHTLAFLQTIQPHLLRSRKLGRLLSSVASERTILQAMLAAVPTPMFACTADAQVRYANPAAEALLRENAGLRTDGLRIVATTPESTDQLAKAIGQASGTISPDGARTGQTLQVPQRSPGGSMTITVMPLPQADGRTPGIECARALIIVHRQQRSLELAVAGLRETFALTPAEVKLVGSMLDGVGLPQVATRLGIGHSTARTHLKHIFAKTQTHRQGELLQLVHSLAH
jgi:DNA-binding CsgD family transcriptional regulator